VAEKSKSNWYWPTLETPADAIKASNGAFWGAIFVASVTAVFATIALYTKVSIATIDASAYIDAGLFVVIAWRIRRRSRAFAVVGLVLFIIEKVLLFISAPQASTSGIFMSVLILLLFINGVRGNFALHRLAKQKQSAMVAEA
jgi:hypothetical protein